MLVSGDDRHQRRVRLGDTDHHSTITRVAGPAFQNNPKWPIDAHRTHAEWRCIPYLSRGKADVVTRHEFKEHIQTLWGRGKFATTVLAGSRRGVANGNWRHRRRHRRGVLVA